TTERWVQVRRDDLSLNCTFQGNIYGLDGQPIAGRSVSLQGAVVSYCSQNLGELSYTESILTGADGSYRFEEIPCCQDCSGVIDGEFRGDLSFDFMRAGTNWTYHEAIDLDCVEGGCNNHDIYLPRLWGSLQGTVYQPDSPAVPFSELHIGSDMGFFGFDKNLLTTSIPVIPDGNGGVAYGPLEVPVGQGIVSDQPVDIIELFGGGDLNTIPQARDYWLPVVNGSSVADFGEATATLTGKVFRDDGTLVADGTQVVLQSTYGFFGSGVWSATATTNSGVYSATVPLTGTVQVFVESAEPSDQDLWRINQGMVNIAGQVVTVDINSAETCIVKGTLYDYQGNPLLVNDIGLSSVIGNGTFEQSFSTSTDESGQFSFSAVHPGIATLFGNACQNDVNVGVFCQFNLMNSLIPNCRPVDSAVPTIQVDLPLLNLLYACSN
ncbi:MAG: hypothetical protein GY934_10195, partial [Gammaproteobacteria bacterium]|nr:hypothetical protein [Gammaproteobacteria bacterium]